MPDSRWTQLPDGPWVLPDLESGIYIRHVARLERTGRPPCYAVTGPGYETTEHPSLEGAMEAAEAERYQPWFSQPLNDWPPMPEVITSWPLKLYVKETTWPYWQGSPTEIARLAKRGEERMNRYFIPFQKLPRDAWWIRPGIPRQQEAVHFSYVVGTRDWAGGTTSDGLRDEIEARRTLVRAITLKASVTDRTWSQVALSQIREGRLVDIFEDSPLTVVESTAIPASETIAPPQLIEVQFRTDFPAVRLRTIARTAYQCADLHSYMLPHIDAGRRKRIWDPALTGSAAAVLGFAVPDVLLLTGVVQPWWAMLLQFTCGPLGMLIPLKLIPWTFPPLELVEAWEKSHWQTVKTTFWQGLILVLAAAGIVATILISQPTATAPNVPSPTTTRAPQP